MQQIVKSLSCKMQRRVKSPLCIAAETFDYLLHMQQGDKSYRCIIQRGIKPYNCIVQPGVKSCRYKMQRWTKFGNGMSSLKTLDGFQSPWRNNHVKSHIWGYFRIQYENSPSSNFVLTPCWIIQCGSQPSNSNSCADLKQKLKFYSMNKGTRWVQLLKKTVA